MKINNPIKIAVFLSLVIFSSAIILYYILDDSISIIYSSGVFFLFTIWLIYYVVKKFFHDVLINEIVSEISVYY